jgi:hypothetical protein
MASVSVVMPSVADSVMVTVEPSAWPGSTTTSQGSSDCVGLLMTTPLPVLDPGEMPTPPVIRL